ncbi:MAG TPA: hypothetical protein VJ872_02610 [Nocardioides sp.]|nr:hypothetical protein [Nocardioides sp.]
MRIRIAVGTLALALVGPAVLVAPAEATLPPEHGFVTSSVTLPFDATQAKALGRDLTGDGKADNQLANVFAALVAQGLDLTQTWNGDIRSGRIVMLHSLRSRSLVTDRNATWQLWYGVPVTNPNLTGTGTFVAGPTRSARIPAKLVRHHLSTAASTIPVRMDLGSGPFQMPMVVGRVFATCFTRCTGGRINGAFRSTSINAVFIPRFAQVLQALVNRDCVGPPPGTCTDGSTGATVDQIFDTAPHDLVITTDEVRKSGLVQALLAPDVDLYKADGSRGKDGKKDSISFGFGFSAVKARIVH